MELVICGGREYKINNVLSYKISNNLFLPCDSLEINFFCEDGIEENLQECREVYLYEHSTLIFSGFADEIIFNINENGKFIKLFARDRLAAIIDNDALPQSFLNPGFENIAAWCLEEFNVKFRNPGFYGRCGTYTIPVGTSCFEAVRKFARQVLGADIYFDRNKTLTLFSSFNQIEKEPRITVGQKEKYKYISFEHKINRADKISEVKAVTPEGTLLSVYNTEINKKYKNITGRKIIKQVKNAYYSEDSGKALALIPNSDFDCAAVKLLCAENDKKDLYDVFAGDVMRICDGYLTCDYIIYEKQMIFDGYDFYINLKGGKNYGD